MTAAIDVESQISGRMPHPVFLVPSTKPALAGQKRYKTLAHHVPCRKTDGRFSGFTRE